WRILRSRPASPIWVWKSPRASCRRRKGWRPSTRPRPTSGGPSSRPPESRWNETPQVSQGVARQMRIAFIADPLPSFKIRKDSTYAMMVEAAKRGHELHFMLQEGLMWKGGRVLGETCRLTLADGLQPWYRTAPPKETPLAEFDVVLM